MVSLDRIVGMLQAKRQELLDQLRGIDRAIAALRGAPTATEVEATDVEPHDVETNDVETNDVETQQTSKVLGGTEPIVPTRLKPKRVLGESHKEALIKGRRKAREAKEVAAGLAREMPDESFVPALAPHSGGELPRLVKRQREGPVESVSRASAPTTSRNR